MFGDVWPVKNWAGLGAVIGAVYQFVQVVMLGLAASGFAYVTGRLLGGALFGAFIGTLVAVIRNLVAGKR